VDRNTAIEDPQELALRTTRQGLLARYFIQVPLLAWLLTGFPIPAGGPAIILASIAAVVVNAACHLHLATTHKHVPAAYISPAMDALFTSWVVLNTGLLASPFIMLLPLFPMSVFHAEFSRSRTRIFGFAMLVLFALITGAWLLRGGQVEGWSPRDYPVFTAFLVFHQFISLVSFAAVSLEMSPLTDALERGQARLDASRHRAELGASLGAIQAGLAPPIAAMEGALSGMEAIAGRIPGDRRATISHRLAECRREVAMLRRLLDGLGNTAQADGRSSEETPVPAAELFGRAIDFMRLKHARLGRTVLYEAVPSPKVTVRCDPDAMHRALVGLMENALSRRIEGRPMRTRLAASARGGEVDLTVTDDGGLLTPAARDGMFASAPPQSPDDPAMSLFLTRRVVEEHGGTASVSSSSPQGTVFILSLPGGPGGGPA